MIESFSKVSEASKLLLEKGLGPSTGVESLSMVGHALGIHRAYIFENRTQGTYGRFITDMRYAWAEPPTPSALANPVLRAFSFRDFAPGWVDMLEAGMVVACPTRDAPPTMLPTEYPRMPTAGNVTMAQLSATSGQLASLSELTIGSNGHWMLNAGSFQRTLRSEAGA